MSKANDGGPAFPVDADTQTGMSLRDWFAGHAPKPPKWWMANYAKRNDLGEDAGCIAQWNYAYADAMIAQREE